MLIPLDLERCDVFLRYIPLTYNVFFSILKVSSYRFESLAFANKMMKATSLNPTSRAISSPMFLHKLSWKQVYKWYKYITVLTVESSEERILLKSKWYFSFLCVHMCCHGESCCRTHISFFIVWMDWCQIHEEIL